MGTVQNSAVAVAVIPSRLRSRPSASAAVGRSSGRQTIMVRTVAGTRMAAPAAVAGADEAAGRGDGEAALGRAVASVASAARARLP
ncbi:hypothetical protein GCM10010124_31550 [Pilimelia terevasa]|uniref:Uncharacterized protein n=1 Tax=Pilimelia terevasa TaxID=53372 RepID=A0A8J3BSM1_9ACTN|nr:hypothetical protein GCM10010124_31550 [Pilimelia terevasa]